MFIVIDEIIVIILKLSQKCHKKFNKNNVRKFYINEIIREIDGEDYRNDFFFERTATLIVNIFNV